MGKRSWKTELFFSVAVFFIQILSNSLTGALLYTLYLLKLLQRISPAVFFPAVTIFSIAVNMLFYRLLLRKPIGAIEQLSDATKEIAKGNYDVNLEEDSRVEELRTMAHNFNLMAAELQSTEILRQDFVANVSHEFKTPLASLEGYATLLQSRNLSEEKRTEYLSKILISTRRLNDLTGNILLLSRLENQQLEVKKELFSLDEQIREIVLVLEHQWSEKNLDLDIDLDSVDFLGSRELLWEVWQNLIGNAIKFTPAEGTISLRLTEDASGVTAIVSDTGIGMDEETIGRIFEKFYQGDRSHASGGNGLGLPLAREIVALHGGTISVESAPEAGSRFTVFLPIV